MRVRAAHLPETFVLDRQGVVAVSRGQVSQKFLDTALAEAQRREPSKHLALALPPALAAPPHQRHRPGRRRARPRTSLHAVESEVMVSPAASRWRSPNRLRPTPSAARSRGSPPKARPSRRSSTAWSPPTATASSPPPRTRASASPPTSCRSRSCWRCSPGWRSPSPLAPQPRRHREHARQPPTAPP